jgi:ferritin-like metal-binding protein YciE
MFSEKAMTRANNLQELYLHLLADTISANRQMAEVVGEMADVAVDDRLAEMLEKTEIKIPEHNAKLEEILGRHGGETRAEHCPGMRGLVEEAREHAIESEIDDDATRDAAIILAVQQMSHYGLAGYGTLAAMARSLGHEEDAQALDADLDEIYDADRYLTFIAEKKVNKQAAA